jgi:hypothetical protein
MRIALPPRIQGGLEYEPSTKCYKLWLHTADFVLGTYLLLYPDGKIERVVLRADEPDQVDTIKP